MLNKFKYRNVEYAIFNNISHWTIINNQNLSINLQKKTINKMFCVNITLTQIKYILCRIWEFKQNAPDSDVAILYKKLNKYFNIKNYSDQNDLIKALKLK